jgi:hypothetical protein
MAHQSAAQYAACGLGLMFSGYTCGSPVERQSYADHLKDPLARLPAPTAWSGWEAYFRIMEYEGDQSGDVH